MSGFGINQVSIDGNLTADPTTRNLPSGTAVTQLRIAHNERRKVGESYEDQAHYFDVTIWGQFGQSVAKQLAKGSRVVVAGRLDWREWQTDAGDKRQAVQIVADSVIPVPRGAKNDSGEAEAA